MELREADQRSATKHGRATRLKPTSALAVHRAFLHKLAARFVFIAAFFCVTVTLLYLARHAGFLAPDRLRAIVENAGVWGPLALIGIIVLTSISLTVPSSPIIFLAGAMYGVRLATIYCMIGLLIGASIAFWVARVFRAPIIRLLGNHAQVLVTFQQKYVMFALFVTRVIPVFNFEVMSYAAGLTSISYPQYVLATLGALASVFIWATLGSIGKHFGVMDAGTGALPIILALMLVIFLFIVPIAIDHYNPWGWKEKLTSAGGKQ